MGEDFCKKLKHQAEEYEYVYHYTSLDSAEIILKNKSFRLNRLDKVNDSIENKRITSLWNKKVFVTCFTHTTKNEKMFYQNYGEVRLKIKYDKNKVENVYKDSELKNKIDEYIKDDKANVVNRNRKSICNWGVRDIIVADVFYTDNLNNHVDGFGEELNAGLIKLKKGFDKQGNERIWEEEEETRIRVAVRPKAGEAWLNKLTNKFEYYKPCFTNLYIPIPGEIVDIELEDGAAEENMYKIKKLKEKHIIDYSV